MYKSNGTAMRGVFNSITPIINYDFSAGDSGYFITNSYYYPIDSAAFAYGFPLYSPSDKKC